MASRQLNDERICHTARLLPDADARADYLDQVCSGNQALRERIEALLEAQDEEQGLRESSPEPAPTAERSPISEGPGHQIGHFKVLQKIGEGGFGVVFMAEQQQPIRRKVALKIIKPGMDSHAVVARFEAERQALALMEHPNIARVFDGGTTESGKPYFVMELVRGVPITEYCDKNQVAIRPRLSLFITVCQAIQHAHQKGIIHRDLKPSNILITLADGQPVVKVIDFGVSKALNQQLTEKTLFTAYGQMIGTPQYMSPEQAEMSCLDVDTRSDVYSLGVLLYELLTGTTPLEGERLRMVGYAEIQRIIREEDPPKPSARLSTLGDRLTAVANHRGTDPKRLRQVIRGELDWIAMKSLEKERGRRYASPSNMAEDVQRFLAGQAVEAHPPSTMYQLRKFVRKYKTPVAAGFVLVLVLILGIMGTTSGRYRAERMARRLQREVEDKEEALGREQRARIRLEEQSYRDHMNLAYQAWNEGNRVQLARLLRGLLPGPSDRQPPGFELRYLWARFQEVRHSATVLDVPMSKPTVVTSIDYSGDGRYFAVGCADKKVHLYDINNATTVTTIPLPKSVRGADVILSTKGTYLAACSTPGHATAITDQDVHPVTVFDIASSKQLSGANWSADVFSAVFSPDDQSLICACADGSIEMRRLPDGEVVWKALSPIAVNRGTRVAISPDGRYIAAATRGKRIVLWDFDSRRVMEKDAPAPHFVNALAFSPDSTSLWVSSSFGVTQWHVSDDGLRKGLKLGNEETTALSFSSDGAVLALGSADYRIRLWDLENSEWLPPLLQEDYVECVAFSPLGDCLAAGGREKVIRLWDTKFLDADSKCLSTRHFHPPMAVSRDGTVATCHQDQESKSILKLWMPGETERVVARLDSMIVAVAFSLDGTLLATGSEVGDVRIWNLATGESRELPIRHAEGVNCLAFSPAQKHLVSGGQSAELWVWSLKDYQRRHLRGHRGHVLSMTFSSEGLLATTGGLWHDYGETFIWDLHDDKWLLHETHPRIGRCVAFSPNGKEIAATDDFSKGVINVYEVSSGKVVSSLVGHSSKTMSLVFGDDGRRLITGSDDGTIRFWDRESGEPLGTLRVNERVRRMALMSDDCTLITTSWDGWTRVRRAVKESEIPRRSHGKTNRP